MIEHGIEGNGMATTASLRSRRSAAQLHALAGVEREIRANDGKGRRKYLLDFSQAYRSYESVLDIAKLPEVVAERKIVLIGDYHALPSSQRFAASLIEQEGRGREVVIGVEAVFARDQHILNEWMEKKIEESELRERIRFDLDWGYEWEPFFHLLLSAREHGTAVYGLDCMPRGDLRQAAVHDRHAAEKIAEIREHHPEALILIVFGESHLAPNHLPQALRKRLPDEHALAILQNVDALYWRAAGETCEQVEAVRVNEDVICVFNATPLEKYESYRLHLEKWNQDDAETVDLGPTVYNLIDSLLRFLRIQAHSSKNGTRPKFLVDLLPEVCHLSADDSGEKLLRARGASEEESRIILHRLRQNGSVYAAGRNVLYVREFRMGQAAEEAARFLHHACRGLPLRCGQNPALDAQETFYGLVLENALAYLGSRVLYPARAGVRDSDIAELYDLTHEDIEEHTTLEYPDFMRLVDYVELHRAFEAKRHRCRGIPPNIKKGWQYAGERLEYVTRQLGYALGTELYDAYLSGDFTNRFLRSLFQKKIEQPGVAVATYSAILTAIRQAKRARSES